MVKRDFTRLTPDEKINGIKATKLPDHIRTKYHGEDVREAIAQSTELTIQLGINMGLSPDDAILWARKLQEAIPRSEFDSWVATLVDGGPSIFMNTLNELKTTYPNGAAGVALVRETDPAKIYVWNGTAWEDFGDYQGIEIKDGTVSSSKIVDGAVFPKKLVGEYDIKGENLYHPSDMINGKYLNVEGVIKNDPTTSMATVNVSPNNVYSFWRKANRWLPVDGGPLVLTKFDGSKENIDASTLTKGIYLGYTYVVFKTDSDTVSVSFNIKVNLFDSSDTTILVEGSAISSKKEIRKIFGSEIVDTKARDAILNYDTQTELTTPINMYDQQYISEGVYIAGDGTFRSSTDVSYAKIPIVGGRKYTLWRGSNIWTPGAAGPVVFSTVENARTNIDGKDYINGTYNDYSYVTITSPDDAAFIEFNTQLLAFDATENTILVEGDSVDGLKEVSKIFGMDIKPKLYTGKKWVALGDSLTESNRRATLNYHDFVAEDLGITVVNMGVSGTGYKQRDSVDRAFYQRISSVPLDTDVITIFGSFNDLSAGVPLGTPSDTGTETLGGAINTTLDNLNTRLPIVPVGIIAPTPWHSSKPWDEANNSTQYVQLLKNICKHRSIPYLDLYYSSGLRPWDVDYRPLMYSKDDGNGVHPDENGHKFISSKFREFLKTLI